MTEPSGLNQPRSPANALAALARTGLGAATTSTGGGASGTRRSHPVEPDRTADHSIPTAAPRWIARSHPLRPPAGRWHRSKIPRHLRMQGIMDARYESEPLGAAAGVCDRPNQSGTPPQERIPGSRESDIAGTPASSPAAIRSGKVHPR